MSQGWRLPDGTPCGGGHQLSSMHSDSTAGLSPKNALNGYCYNGACKPYNCNGEVSLRSHFVSAHSPASSNVYSGGQSGNSTTMPPPITNAFNALPKSSECGRDIFASFLVSTEDDGGGDSSTYRLVQVNKLKCKFRERERERVQSQQLTIFAYRPARPNQTSSTAATLPVSLTQSPVTPPTNPFSAYVTPPPSVQYSPPAVNVSHYASPLPASYAHYSNWSSWHPVTECQYSTACITSGRGFQLVTRECQHPMGHVWSGGNCIGRREALQVCNEISAHVDEALYAMYAQYCPLNKRITAGEYAVSVCTKYQIKYPSLLSGSGRQLLGKLFPPTAVSI